PKSVREVLRYSCLAIMIQHTLYCGTTRFGKSECCISRICPQMLKKDRASYFCFDPPGSMSRKISTFLVIKNIPHLYDKISETEKTLGYPFCPNSADTDPVQAEAFN